MDDEIFMTKDKLMRHLGEDSRVFANQAIRDAFEAVDRRDFVQEDYKVEAYEDYPLPTIDGQTISQPTTVAFMLELLDAKKGDSALDIGSGSGWTTALLGHMVGKEGRVIGLDIKQSLVDLGKKNIKKYQKDFPIEIRQAKEGELGLYAEGPYERILCNAAFASKEDAPLELLLQLVPGGVAVVPIGDSIVKFERKDEDEYFETEYPGFAFVPYLDK